MTLRWGILGPGKIARVFAEALAVLEDHELVAAGSRDAGRAADFAARYGAARAHVSYRDLIADDGVDAVFDRGELAILDCAVRTATGHDAFVFGTGGEICIERFSRATTAHLRVGDDHRSESRPFRANGFEYQAIEVARCVREGLIESPGMSHRGSVEVMAVMDEVRRQVGLRYPFEEAPGV